LNLVQIHDLSQYPLHLSTHQVVVHTRNVGMINQSWVWKIVQWNMLELHIFQ
jgi:hypothetical protein